MPVVPGTLQAEPLLRRMAQFADRRLWQSGPMGSWRKARYERHFEAASGNVKMFRGIYDSYEAAAASAPGTHPVGWENVPSAQRLEHERLRVFTSDYPTLFWLSRLLAENSIVFDLHGNVGTAYFAFRRLLPFPENLTWLVHDVRPVVARGRSLARTEDAPGLRFTEDLCELPRADILLIKGAVQFLRDPIDFLKHAGRMPRHVLINKVPIYDREPAVTLEANGVAFCPYHLLNRRQFVATFEDQGYRRVDSWLNYDLNCYIPFFPEYTIPTYSGFYFARDMP